MPPKKAKKTKKQIEEEKSKHCYFPFIYLHNLIPLLF